MPLSIRDRPSAAAGVRSKLPDPRRPHAIWTRLAIIVGVVGGVGYNLIGFPPFGRPWGQVYHLDLDVYRLAGQAFLRGTDLYHGLPATQLGVPLPFVYPPFAALLFGPGAELSLPHLGVVMTVLSMTALAASIVVTLRSLGIGPADLPDAGRLGWTAGAAVVVAFTLEPVFATLEFGQVNLILFALVAADCLLRRTPWPRGLLIGVAAAVKLTPIVFVVYLLLRRDVRAVVVAVAGFAACTALGFLLAFQDSVEFWRGMLDGRQALQVTAYVGNQSIGAVLLRLGLPGDGIVWLAAAAVVGGLALVGMWRAVRGGRYALAFGINGVGGLLASPVAWSHHWVYVVPALLAIGHEAYRTRGRLLALILVAGLLLFHFAPHFRVGYWHQDGIGYSLTDQLVIDSYVWWGLALLVVAASYRTRRRRPMPRPAPEPAAEPAPA